VILDRLRAVVGDAHVLTDADVRLHGQSSGPAAMAEASGTTAAASISNGSSRRHSGNTKTSPVPGRSRAGVATTTATQRARDVATLRRFRE